MTKITIDRAVVEQALHVATGAGYPLALIAALKAALAEPQEPVVWAGYDLEGMVEAFFRVIEAHHSSKHPFHNPIDMDAKMALRILRGFIPAMKAYAAPPQRKPLTEEEIWALYYALPSDDFERSDRIDFARAIEAAHGIKEGT
jgi:hypothetical protein